MSEMHLSNSEAIKEKKILIQEEAKKMEGVGLIKKKKAIEKTEERA